MADRKMSEMSLDNSLDGTERILAQGADGACITTAVMAAYAVDQLHQADVITSLSDAHELVVFVSDVEKIITVANLSAWVIDEIEAITTGSTITSGDTLIYSDGGTLKQIDIDDVESYLQANLESASHNFTSMDAVVAVAGTDVFALDQGAATKKLTYTQLSAEIWGELAANVAGCSAISSPSGSDQFYVSRAGADKSITLTVLSTYLLNQIDPDGASWMLDEDDMASNDDTKVPSQQSVKAFAETIANHDISSGTDIGEALADGDLFSVYNLSSTVVRKSAVSRIWTYIWAQMQAASAKASPVAADILLIQDSEDSNSIKEVTFAELKTHLDTVGTYDEVWIPASQMTPSTTNGAAADTKEYGTNDMTHETLLFDGAAQDESAEFDLVMPPSWDLGTIKFKAYWTNGHADANADEYIRLGLAAAARSNDDDLDDNLGTAGYVTDQLIADDDMHITSASDAITIADIPALGDMIHFKLTRDYDYDGGGGTAMDVDLRLLGILIQYQKTVAVSAW